MSFEEEERRVQESLRKGRTIYGALLLMLVMFSGVCFLIGGRALIAAYGFAILSGLVIIRLITVRTSTLHKDYEHMTAHLKNINVHETIEVPRHFVGPLKRHKYFWPRCVLFNAAWIYVAYTFLYAPYQVVLAVVFLSYTTGAMDFFHKVEITNAGIVSSRSIRLDKNFDIKFKDIAHVIESVKPGSVGVFGRDVVKFQTRDGKPYAFGGNHEATEIYKWMYTHWPEKKHRI